MSWSDDITVEEEAAIEELRKRTINDFTPKMLEDDSVCYRFMKARDFNLELAEGMLRKHINWRKKYKIDTILDDYKPSEVLQKYSGTSSIGFDKEGSPVRFIDFGRLDTKGLLSSMKLSDLVRFNVWIFEQDIQTLHEQSKKLGKSLTKVTYIEDLEGLSLFTVTHKATIEGVMLNAKVYQDNYPERMKTLYIFNASSIVFTIGLPVLKSIFAPRLLEKFRIFDSSGWKEALQEAIDPDELPAFLGGNKTDPDGNPLCNTFVNHAGPVPKSYHLQKSQKAFSKAPGVQKLIVRRFSKDKLSFEVEEAGSFLVWEFETKSRDIGFGVYFRESSSDKSENVELVPKQRLDSYYEPETGMCKCERPGKYTIVFDNSYSWIYSKEIYYRISIQNSNDYEE